MAPVNLHFEDSGNWYSLPEWAEYFINIGKGLAGTDHELGRIVTAIIVPTRAFAAAFASLGIVIADAAARDRVSATVHFEALFDLPAGTPVIYRRNPRSVLKGVLCDPVERDGKLYVRVQVHSREGGGLTYELTESLALQVQPASHSGKLPKNQSGGRARLANAFVDSLLGDADPIQLGHRSRLVCALVGRRSALEHEIRHTPLAIHANGNQHSTGHLQDILRVNRFVTGQQSYRSALVPVGTSLPPEHIVTGVEKAVLFDGAIGFLKWGNGWPGRHQVIVLDRTEPYFDDAVSALNQRFVQNGGGGDVSVPALTAPPGGEVLTFREGGE
jgi:hypothetical protein